MSNDTLSVASVNFTLFALRQRGLDVDALAQSVGLDARQLQNPDGRARVSQMQALWPKIIAATGDPDISLKLGELVNPAAIGVLAYVMMHMPTLGQAFEKLCQYQDIVCEGIATSMRWSGEADNKRFWIISLKITSADIIYPAHALNAELSVYLAASRMLTGQFVAPKEAWFAYSRPADTREHERVFAPATLHFDAPETNLLFDADTFNLPILNATPSLSTLFEKHADDLLSRLRTPSLDGQVRAEIVRMMKGEEPTLAAVADRLSMGVRTLQLHLKEAGTSYQQLLDDTRKELAVSHLRESNLSLTDIAYLLGFAEPSVFFRSFKKWTGRTPGAYRTSQLAA